MDDGESSRISNNPAKWSNLLGQWLAMGGRLSLEAENIKSTIEGHNMGWSAGPSSARVIENSRVRSFQHSSCFIRQAEPRRAFGRADAATFIG